MWLGTDEGLYRYDGYSLRSYQHNPNNPRTLSDNVAQVIYKDRSGTLWIGTGYGGLDRFDPALDAFTHYRHDPNDSRSLRSDQVWCIYQDRAGSLWIGTTDGLDRLDLATGSFTHYSHPVGDNAGGHAIRAIYEDGQGSFLFGGADGRLYTLDPSGARLSRFPNRAIESSRHDHGYIIRDFKQDRAGTLWASSLFENEVTALNTKTEELRRYSYNWKLPGSREASLTTKIHEDRNRVLWVGTNRDGLLKFDPERKSFARYSTQSAGTFPDDHVWSLFEDSEGNLWVGNASGVFRFQTGPLPFVSYQREAGNPNSLRSNKVHSVYADKRGFLWIGTAEGLHRLDRKTGQMVVYQHDPRQPNSLSNNDVSAIKEDSSGTLWIGTRGGGLNRFDRATGRFTAYRHNPKDPQSLHWDKILCLSVEPGGTLWAGTEEHGLSRMDPSTGRFKEYRHNPGDTRSLSQNQARSILVDRAGTLWVGTNRGLNRFERGHEGFTVYLHDERNPASISNEGINAIYEDRQGTLWIGTRRGLNRLDRTRGSFVSFTTQDGLANDAIQGIQEDSRGNLWLATQGGLSEFVPGTKAVRNFAAQGGLPEDFANPIGTGDRSSVTPEGDLVFGSQYGVTVFSPDRVSANPYRPPVVLTDFLLFNKPVPLSGKSPLQRPIWATQAITLDHKQSIFTLEFAALSYVAPERNRLRYKLEGLETEWNEVGGSRHVATYTELPPQTYVFRVQGSNNDLVWNETGARLEITVLPPWWGTWWFRSVALLSIAGLGFAVYRWRVRSLRLAAHRLERVVEQRTRDLQTARDSANAANRAKSSFLANMSHELRTPLNAILGFSSLLSEGEVSEKQRKDLNIINRSGEHLLNLINDVLDVAKVESGRLELNVAPCDLKCLMSDVRDMMSARAAEKNLTLRLVESPEFPPFASLDAVKLRQVLINLIGNAVKFTGQGAVTLRTDSLPVGDGRLLLTFEVEDTGIGISEEDQSRIFDAFVQAGKADTRKGTGLGLTISRQFVELMGGTIQVASTLGKGTQFRVQLPVDRVEKSEVTFFNTEAERIVGVELGRPDYRVLIVDDAEENRLVLLRWMENAGFQVRLAEDGGQAVEVFQDWRPHFIWMDLRMALMDGKEAVRRIRALGGGLDTRIAVVTASAFASERDEVLAAGADDFIRKPYQRSEIFECMALHLGLQRIYGGKPKQEDKHPIPDLDALPEHVVHELAAEVLTLDQRRILDVIARTSEFDEAIAQKLTHLAGAGRYTAILVATKAYGKKSR